MLGVFPPFQCFTSLMASFIFLTLLLPTYVLGSLTPSAHSLTSLYGIG